MKIIYVYAFRPNTTVIGGSGGISKHIGSQLGLRANPCGYSLRTCYGLYMAFYDLFSRQNID